VDALLVTNLTNVRYLTGFSGTNGQVLVHADGAVFFTDPRYEARAGDLVSGAEIAVYPARITDLLGDRLASHKVSVLGVEGSMTLAERDDLQQRLGLELTTTSGLVEQLRRTKDSHEIELLREAIRIGDAAFAWVLDRLVPGVTEREVGLDLEVHMRQNGADGISFPPIVGSGPLSAHIHHAASDRIFEKGDLVLLDFGCTYGGYCSDLTRTVVLGPASDDQLEMYGLVLSAHNAGIAAVCPGAKGADVDAAARTIITEAGYGERFGHGLGHGVGLDIHEAPRLHRISEDTLGPGDVVTIEPGVYIPDTGGVRIEDCVLVTEPGAEVLGAAPKDRLIEL
jgi:Xaa-Pro aminopeptidase